MFIEISDIKTIGQIQREFCQAFPFLRIEFLDEPGKHKSKTCKDHCCKACTPLGDFRKKHNPGALQFSADTRTGDLEAEFKNHFGLNVQVCRNMCGTWVQTRGTDHLTLAEQDELAQRSQKIIHPELNDRIEESEY